MKRNKVLIVMLTLLLFVSSFSTQEVHAESGVEGFVTRLYTLCLKRQPD